MPEADLWPETLDALARQFGAAPPPDSLQAPLTLDDVRRFLVPRITRLLDRNPSLLLSLLYRIDVAERDVKRALAQTQPGALPGALADLIIARQLQKVRTRRAYREG